MTIYDDVATTTVGTVPVAMGIGLLHGASRIGTRRRPATRRRVVLVRRPVRTAKRRVVRASPKRLSPAGRSSRLRYARSRRR